MIGTVFSWLADHASAAWSSPLAGWGLAGLLLFISLWQSMPNGYLLSGRRRFVVSLIGVCGLVLLWRMIPTLQPLGIRAAFAGFATLTIVAAVATISSRSPVYSAIWFALSLLGTAGLFLLQGAQFLGVATVAVYAGAIVVTFLFVLMLAQPEGHAYYDRISWGAAPRFFASLTAVFFVVLVVMAGASPDVEILEARRAERDLIQAEIAKTTEDATVRAVRYLRKSDTTKVEVSLAPADGARGALSEQRTALETSILASVQSNHPDWRITEAAVKLEDVQAKYHAANLGAELFGRQLISVQVAGVLLLAALVGAVAIAARGGTLDAEPSDLGGIR